MRSFYAILIAIFVSACGGKVDDSHPNSNECYPPGDSFMDQTGGMIAQNGSGGSAGESSAAQAGSPSSTPSAGAASEEEAGGEAGFGEHAAETGGAAGEAGSPSSTPSAGAAGETGHSDFSSSAAGTAVATAGAEGSPVTGGSGGQDETPSKGGDAAISGAGGQAGESSIGGAGGSVGTSAETGVSGEGGSNIPSTLPLEIELASDTPETAIVIPSVNYPFTKYVVTNPNDTSVSIDRFDVDEVSPNGEIADFAAVRVNYVLDGEWLWSITYTVYPVGDDLTRHLNRAPLPFGNTNFMVPANGQIELEITGLMSIPLAPKTAGSACDGIPCSGEMPALKLVNVMDDNGVRAVVQDHDPEPMVLFRNAPVITWDVINEPLHDGLNTVARLTITAAHAESDIALQQVLFDVEESEGLILEEADEGSFVVWGEAFPNSPDSGLLIAPQNTFGKLVFFDGDRYVSQEGNPAAAPMSIELRMNVSNVQPGSSIRTSLRMQDADAGVTIVQLLGRGSPGVIMAGPHQPNPPFTAALFWSDLSEGSDHHPLIDAGGTFSQSSWDYMTAFLVPGADGSCTITAP